MPGTLADRLLDLAAGCPVDSAAYHRYSLNIPRLTAMGRAYRAGWLDNVLARITPMTAYSLEDYLVMADLFVPEADKAMALLEKMSADMNAFAAAAGLNPCTDDTAGLRAHKALYESIAALLERKFEFAAPAAFKCTVLGDVQQMDMMFTRRYMGSGEARLPTWLNSDPDY